MKNKKQRNQLIALVALLVVWAVLWHFFIKVRPPPPPPAKEVAKTAQTESPLKIRFRRVRAEMDVLYHYRLKPIPFNAHWNPFRIPGVSDVQPAAASASKAPGSAQLGVSPLDSSETLLKNAVSTVRVGGIVTRNGAVQLTVDGQLHKEGDVFTVRVQGFKNQQAQSVAIRIKQLSEAVVTFALDDPEAGNAELKIRLK